MSSDRRSNKKQQNALDALSSLAGGDDPLAPAEDDAPAPQAPSRPAAQAPSDDGVVEIPKVPTRPTQPAAGSGRPDTPPAVRKAAKATPARAVSRTAAPAAAKPRAATATTQRGRRVDPVKVRRRIAGMKQAEGWRQTAFPVLVTIGLLLVSLGIVGLSLMPGEKFDPSADTDNWDTDPNSPLAGGGMKFLTYASFPVGAVVIFGGILLVVQANRLKNLRMADERLLEPPEEAE